MSVKVKSSLLRKMWSLIQVRALYGKRMYGIIRILHKKKQDFRILRLWDPSTSFTTGAIEIFCLKIHRRSCLAHTFHGTQNVYLIGAINNSPGRWYALAGFRSFSYWDLSQLQINRISMLVVETQQRHNSGTHVLTSRPPICYSKKKPRVFSLNLGSVRVYLLRRYDASFDKMFNFALPR